VLISFIFKIGAEHSVILKAFLGCTVYIETYILFIINYTCIICWYELILFTNKTIQDGCKVIGPL